MEKAYGYAAEDHPQFGRSRRVPLLRGTSRRSLQHADATATLRPQPPLQPQKAGSGQ
ncbi:hypothetical protein AGR5A_Cc170514 [Agrobacterium genomosp. 5 str. CFBP 6626]|nr:hypothetical protein AGR5A_Cc170514 [Agrobacterium genomosp. 5 str. CFBP 6626]